MRAPSSFHSTDASPVSASASAMLAAGEASIGCTGWVGLSSIAASPGLPSVRATRAAVASDPVNIAPRWTSASETSAALATAAAMTPSSAPWRSSPPRIARIICCSGSVALASSSCSEFAAASDGAATADRSERVDRVVDVVDRQCRLRGGVGPDVGDASPSRRRSALGARCRWRRRRRLRSRPGPLDAGRRPARRPSRCAWRWRRRCATRARVPRTARPQCGRRGGRARLDCGCWTGPRALTMSSAGCGRAGSGRATTWVWRSAMAASWAWRSVRRGAVSRLPDPVAAVAAIEAALGPRWVWWDRSTADVVVAGGVAIARCWDVLTVHRLLRGGWRASVPGGVGVVARSASDSVPAMGQLGLLDVGIRAIG